MMENPEELTQVLRDLERYLTSAGITVEWPMEAPAPGELGGKWPGYLLMVVTTFSELNHALERIEHYWEQEQHTVFTVHSSDKQTNEDLQKEIERKQYHIHVEEPTTGIREIESVQPDSARLKLKLKTKDFQEHTDSLYNLERHLQVASIAGIEIQREESDGKMVALLLLIVQLNQSCEHLENVNTALKRIHDWSRDHRNLQVVLCLTDKPQLNECVRQEVERKNYGSRALGSV